MGQRLELHALLKTYTPNVYFQPPSGLQMSYPCIVYKRDDIYISYADNNPYREQKKYQLTVMDEDADSDIPDKVAKLPMCSFDRHFTADKLNHDVFNLFF